MARLGVDIGGTFTDFVLESGGTRRTLKLLTTATAPERAVLDGLDRLLADAGLRPDRLEHVIHGTTLATNAVIERRGARTAFVTTEGFRDTLELGYESRHDHYDLAIRKPAPIVPRDLRFVLPERISATGAVVRALAPAAIDALLPRLAAAGVEAVAVGFLHSYRNPVHERAVAAAIRARHPEWAVSISAEVAPEMREYERFTTTCVNACLQPLVARYLARLEAGLRERGVRAPLLLMLSDGALTDVATATRLPVRLLESGPAGGAILGAHLARTLGIARALLVDVGGTTAKLCLIDDGVPQFARSIEVARLERFKSGSGLPLRLPVVELAEIGAGGGSIAYVDALGRLAVGPASAGAVPGPACYGHGGMSPTVSDAHLVLGRLDAARFAGGALTLDQGAAAAALAPLAARLGLALEDAAWSVCEMVDESMANAAREHAVETARGLAGRTLVAIGGMAPLHATALAAKLGIDRVVVPDAAGVGSALGFLLAPIAFEHARSANESLDRLDAAATERLVDGLVAEATDVVRRVAPGRPIVLRRSAWMRYRGQGHEIRVALEAVDRLDAATLAGAFEAAYRSFYGRTVAAADIEIIGWTVRVEAAAHDSSDANNPAVNPAVGHKVEPAVTRAMVDQASGATVHAEIHRADALVAGAELHGPAVVVQSGTSAIVPAGARARVLAGGHLLIERTGATRGHHTLPAAIRDQVIWARLLGVVEAQARTLMRTAFSPTVREAGDLSAGLFDREGRMLAQAVTGTPGHVNSMAASARHFIARFPPETMCAGDHYITNDPWLTSGHLHDITVLSPVVRDGRVIGYLACTCHQVDIGGLGQGPDGRSVYEEGLYLPVLRLARAGELSAEVLDIVRANVRQPELVTGDILSYVTANEVSAGTLLRTLEEFGEADLARIGEHIIERSRAAMRAAIAELPRGTHRHALRLDGYEQPVDIRCEVRIEPTRITVDFAGSSAQSDRGINLVLNYTRAYAAFGVRAAVAPEVPNNAGSLECVEVDAPVGSVLNAPHPAPVCARHIIGQFLPEVVLGALATVLPDRVPAEGAACNWGLQLRGTRDAGGAPFEILFFNAGGSGARPSGDGLSATAFPSGIRSIPVEVCEQAAPILITCKELLADSGGPGRLRGGLGQRVEVRTLSGAAFQFFGIFDRVDHPARGRDGGADGRPGWVGLASGRPLRAMGLQTVPAGETLRIDVPGGGGVGDPRARDPRARENDLRLGYVSAAAPAAVRSPMLRVFHTDHSPFAARVRMAAYAKGLALEWVDPPDGPGSRAFGTVVPLAMVPALVLADGTTLPESETIVEYLEERFPGTALLPADLPERARARLIARIADLYLAEPLRALFEAAKSGGPPPAEAHAHAAAIRRALGWLDHYVASGPYAVGARLSTADCALVPLLFFVARCADLVELLAGEHALAGSGALARYWQAIKADPVAQRVLDEMTRAQARRAEERARTGTNAIR